jgi:hypothetical protein
MLPLIFAMGDDARKSEATRVCVGLEAILRVEVPKIKVGAEPQFVLSLRNTGKESLRILDVRGGRRSDLQDTYFEVLVQRQGQRVSLPRPICDPGPISEEDFFQLLPGVKEDIRLSEPCLDLTALKPGAYEAHVSLWPDAELKTRCDSSEARFEVVK